MTRFGLVLCAAFILAGCSRATATTYYYAGVCHPGSYRTIGEAVAAVPAGSTILICPGTYAEQVFISKPLTLHGMSNSSTSGPVIAVPSDGLLFESSLFVATGVAPQIEVLADGVTLSNLIVDGTAGSSNCPIGVSAGIMFADGSSGTVNQVAMVNQNCDSGGIAILAENGAGTERTVTIEGSSVRATTQSAGYYGIVGFSDQSSSTLTLNIENNGLATGANWGIAMAGSVAGTISNNTVQGAAYGIYSSSTATVTIENNLVNYTLFGIDVAGGQPTVRGNTSIGNTVGIDVEDGQPIVTGNTIVGNLGGPNIGIEASGGKITSNHIFDNSQGGINILSNTVTVQGNHIANASTAITFNCNSPTVSGNLITDTPIGIAKVPASYTGANTFSAVPTVRSGGC